MEISREYGFNNEDSIHILLKQEDLLAITISVISESFHIE